VPVPRPPLVTGATGFAGAHLVSHLLEDEPAVAAWANPAGQRPAARPRVEWAAVDLLNPVQVRDALRRLRPSAVYHCAGAADVGGSWTDPDVPLRVNVLGTLHLLDGIRESAPDARVMVVTSALVYRESASALDEGSPIGPATPYGWSKLAQEMLALDRQASVARPFNHAGPRQSPAYSTSAFAKQIAEIECGRRAPEISVGNLDARRDITDVRDTVRAYRLVMGKGRPARPYNVCSGHAYRIGDLLDVLVSMSSVGVHVRIDPARIRPVDHPVLLGDASRLHAETGWTPSIPIEGTLSDLLQYWRERTRTEA
jgi:GDP-4-dehydro-6-deoxy-D-mannose reductase